MVIYLITFAIIILPQHYYEQVTTYKWQLTLRCDRIHFVQSCLLGYTAV
jgi:hypothetical protein